MKKINKLLLGVFIGMGLSILMITLMAATPAPPSSYGNISYITQRDGMKIYHYGNFVIVKTNNAVSISR
tara:strand:- start:143 stop:349 length:207 start_codon:yes stop_codon:yes gene_type:complete